jgi:hypothetical protein
MQGQRDGQPVHAGAEAVSPAKAVQFDSPANGQDTVETQQYAPDADRHKENDSSGDHQSVSCSDTSACVCWSLLNATFSLQSACRHSWLKFLKR